MTGVLGPVKASLVAVARTANRESARDEQRYVAVARAVLYWHARELHEIADHAQVDGESADYLRGLRDAAETTARAGGTADDRAGDADRCARYAAGEGRS